MDFRNEMRRDCDPFARGAEDGRFSPNFAPACAQKRGGAVQGERYTGDGMVRGAENGMVRGAENGASRGGRGQCRCGMSKSVIGEKAQQAINTLPLAMVYSPEQRFDGIKEVCCALEVGTIFDALDMPFCGAKMMRGVKR